MRYEKGHKQATRQRIVAVAARRFRKHGIAATGLAGIMAEAGLTNGGFYSHFKSKSELVREVFIYSLEQMRTDIWPKLGNNSSSLEEAVCEYLGTRHRDKPERGCPTAALVAELARGSKSTRNSFTTRLKELMDLFLEKLQGKDPHRLRQDALAIFGLLVGSLQLARVVTDKRLSMEILQGGTDAAIRLIRQT